ncbi:MAG TPA: SAM-dependent chlorinase/fluorinase [Anaerolineae bacterium]|nr:SAM-dependent chlorinase/fluorinase [Anaerolineae bacterium]
MPIITLTTDFGLADGYVAAMKGVILSIAPQATLIDITHQIAPQNVREAAYVLHTALPYFPPGAVHVAVVDPGVGSARRPMAARVDGSFLVGPDNGVFTFALHGAGQPAACLHLDNPAYWLPQVSRTFHGRDIFSPMAAHLANGVPLEALGTPIDDPICFDVRHPQREADGSLRGEVIHVDRFGNLVSNIPGDWLAGRLWNVRIAGQQIIGPSLSYAEIESGQLLTLVSSNATLEVAVRDGSAAGRLGVAAGEPIDVYPHER